MESTTIAAISTALSEGGIGIVRISGPEAFDIVAKIYKNKDGLFNLKTYKSHTIHYGHICDGDRILDEVMVSVMKAPNTFTREDIVEINCHGGVLVLQEILSLVLQKGARLAEPGEFTKRAFLNGRIDLSKAEAVMDLISSRSEAAMKNSINHLQGRLFNIIKSLRERTLYEIAFIESALDDPEHISLDGYPERLMGIVTELKNEASKLYDTVNKGRFLCEGINTVIVGKPNVGKSSLLNVLSGFERAIVTDIAGTTRDTIEERITLKNVSLNLIDTAGIRETSDKVENIGVERSKKYAENADLILFLIDSTDKLSAEDKEIASLIQDKKVIVLLNKIDAGSVINPSDVKSLFTKDCVILEISAKDAIGIDKLEEIIDKMFLEGKLASDEEIYITSMRQAQELRQVIDSYDLVINSLNDDMPEDFYSIDLMNAYTCLGRIIGEDVDDDLVNEIFSRFCMGK